MAHIFLRLLRLAGRRIHARQGYDMPTEMNLNGWDKVRRSQADAAAVIRELHTEMDRDIRHTRRSGQTRVDVVHTAIEQVALEPEAVA